ncbi:hypothetical protein AAEX28_15885 [Lentisphaerota bacterium WC36G]|nr:hypothetical protein LJT99_02645 [Lentisphaerae bacterium WC36]
MKFKKSILTTMLLLIFTILKISMINAADPNEFEKCPPHMWKNEKSIDCNIKVVGGHATYPCNTTKETVLNNAYTFVSHTGACESYYGCSVLGCSAQKDKVPIPVTIFQDSSYFVDDDWEPLNVDPYIENGYLMPGYYRVCVPSKCHKFHYTPPTSATIKSHEKKLCDPYIIPCNQAGVPGLHSIKIHPVKVPVGFGYRFDVDWGAMGQDIFPLDYCTVCGGVWELSEQLSKGHVSFCPSPETNALLGVFNVGDYWTVHFPSVKDDYYVKFERECIKFQHTFPGWDQIFDIGDCQKGEYTFNLEAVGVKSLNVSGIVAGYNDHNYVLVKDAKGVKFTAEEAGNDWPKINPYTGARVLYPKWITYYKENFIMSDGNPVAELNSDEIKKYLVSATCGIDYNSDADPDNNIAKKTECIHVINPKPGVEVLLPVSSIVGSDNASSDDSPGKTVFLKCGGKYVDVDLTFNANGADVGDLTLNIKADPLRPGDPAPEYEIYTSGGRAVPTGTSTTIKQPSEDSLLYSLVTTYRDAKTSFFRENSWKV